MYKRQALDTLGEKYGWTATSNTANFNEPLTTFVNKKTTALLLDINDEGTQYLERTIQMCIRDST